MASGHASFFSSAAHFFSALSQEIPSSHDHSLLAIEPPDLERDWSKSDLDPLFNWIGKVAHEAESSNPEDVTRIRDGLRFSSPLFGIDVSRCSCVAHDLTEEVLLVTTDDGRHLLLADVDRSTPWLEIVRLCFNLIRCPDSCEEPIDCEEPKHLLPEAVAVSSQEPLVSIDDIEQSFENELSSVEVQVELVLQD